MSATIKQQSATLSGGSTMPTARCSPMIDGRGANTPRQASSPLATAPRTSRSATRPASPVSLAEILGRPGRARLYRGGWRPYYNIVLRTCQAGPAARVATGIQTPGRRRTAQHDREAELSFTASSRGRRSVARHLGMVFESSADGLGTRRELGLDIIQGNADDSPDLPLPTALIID